MSQLTDLKAYVSYALDCTRLRLVRDEADVENEELVFAPEMAHQIFGESESIFGYRDLKIEIMASAGPLDLYFDISYTKKVEELQTEGLKADDVEKSLADMVENGSYYTNLDEFKRVHASKAPTFRPLGTKVDEFKFQLDGKGSGARTFEVYVASAEDAEYMKFHTRLEMFSFWYIDGFSRVEIDPLWLFFTVYERYETDNNNESAANDSSNVRYATVGYVSVYQYYSYPNKVRPRVSQILILPPFQKLGIATRLIKHTTYEYFRKMDNITDITFEEPIEAIQHIRSVVDAKRCKELPAFAVDKLRAGFSKDMLHQARETYLINPKQCRVVYEILRLGVTDTDNAEQYRAYRIEVKKRLNMNYSRHRRDLARAKKRGVDVTVAMCGLPSVSERIESLNAEYKAVEEIYGLVLQKLLAEA
ncbi:histone acetyltransferase type B catalytic subunit [Anopheles maculipalpis]|uniref:histone acetyltransferase type B catalytic subunit n=1 Tax=Anopheles maculipalpis TaxID=1496333 RepID=UPI0021595F14|nr:histone acetyltransferase type B catalytic subunit [Anopheles maculipalpis]